MRRKALLNLHQRNYREKGDTEKTLIREGKEKKMSKNLVETKECSSFINLEAKCHRHKKAE